MPRQGDARGTMMRDPGEHVDTACADFPANQSACRLSVLECSFSCCEYLEGRGTVDAHVLRDCTIHSLATDAQWVLLETVERENISVHLGPTVQAEARLVHHGVWFALKPAEYPLGENTWPSVTSEPSQLGERIPCSDEAIREPMSRCFCQKPRCWQG
ncbi:hypothetical protein VTI74DRAFT_9131 [Chaetomium olivicolor]